MADIGLNFWLTAWNWEPSILIGTALIVGLYLYAVGPLRKRYHLAERVKRSQVVYFLLGVFLMFLALVSPLDELGDTYLFSAHMVQHLFLTIIGPPLLLLGTPAWLVKPLLHQRTAFLIARGLTFPAVAFDSGEPEYSYTGASHLHRLWCADMVAHLQSLGGGITTPLSGRPDTLSLLQRHARRCPWGRPDILLPAVCPLHSGAAHLGDIRCNGSTAGWSHHVDSWGNLIYYHYEHSLHSLDAEARGKTAAGRSRRI